ncbi:DNA photolyase family protein [Candidatus Pelagibacter sp.]|nr:DNA photolyase family protein [Candidatus Pelagibacter sp.]
MTKKAIVWIREDFRIENNEALAYASQNHEFVSVLYIYNSKTFDKQREAQKWWLSKSLEAFNLDLKKFNISLEIQSGDELEVFSNIKKKDDVTIYWSKIYEPDVINKGKKIRDLLIKNEIEYKYFKGNILVEFQDMTKDDGTPYKVFTPFWKKTELFYISKPISKNFKVKLKEKKISIFKKSIIPEEILPKNNWYKKLEKYWTPSEQEAKKYLNELIKDKIKDYGDARDIPGINGTSKLSPFLKFGQIHVETIWKKCQDIKIKKIGYRKYINELGWREFSHSLINYFPQMLKGNLRKDFDNFPWVKNEKHLDNWKKGMTGYPIVDAGMRELYETGWMHNRVRMIVASFLVKHLRIHWMEGEKHFKNCLVDYNEASNVAQWQWVAGCGADAAPYFRIFNPILQGEKFDKDGIYTKKWVPELLNMPNKFLYKPWELEKKYQEQIKVIIGTDYPEPMVDHATARIAALEAFQKIKKN